MWSIISKLIVLDEQYISFTETAPCAVCLALLVCSATQSNSDRVYKWACDLMANPQVMLEKWKKCTEYSADKCMSRYHGILPLLLYCGQSPSASVWKRLNRHDIDYSYRCLWTKGKLSLGFKIWSLSQLCRLFIRNNMHGPNLFWCMDKVEYPQKLKDFILMISEPYVLSTQMTTDKPYSLDDIIVEYTEPEPVKVTENRDVETKIMRFTLDM